MGESGKEEQLRMTSRFLLCNCLTVFVNVLKEMKVSWGTTRTLTTAAMRCPALVWKDRVGVPRAPGLGGCLPVQRVVLHP